MKKLFYFTALIMCSQPIIAQTLTLTNYSMQPGESFDYAKGDYQAGGSSGANQQWTIAAVTNSTSENYVVVAANPLIQQLYPGADLSVNNGSTAKDFFDFTPSEMLYLGSMQGTGPATTAINYTDPEKTMAFPFSYSDTFTDNWATQSGISGSSTLTADATGTLTTPYGTFTNTLRVTINRVNISSTFTLTTHIVNWYTPNVHNYLASAILGTLVNTSTTSVISSLYVLKAGPTVTVGPVNPVDPLSIAETGNSGITFAVLPTPASEGVVIHTTKALSHAGIKLYDAHSNLVMELHDLNGTEHAMNRKDLTRGIYFFVLEENGSILKGRIIFD